MINKTVLYLILFLQLLALIAFLTGCDLTLKDEKPKSFVIGIINLVPELETVVNGFKEGMKELG